MWVNKTSFVLYTIFFFLSIGICLLIIIARITFIPLNKLKKPFQHFYFHQLVHFIFNGEHIKIHYKIINFIFSLNKDDDDCIYRGIYTTQVKIVYSKQSRWLIIHFFTGFSLIYNIFIINTAFINSNQVYWVGFTLKMITKLTKN